MRNYWLINHRTKQYAPIHNIENDFFDGDWKEKTPFATEDYIDLDCQTVWPDQKANEYLFYSYDLCRDGMRVGVFYDEDRVSKEEVNSFISTLRRKQDVAFSKNYSLKLYTQKGE
ncbi:MAG: hypothetical protein RBR35_17660 [Salinivirgaceae bacterium]|nr:hypothetical protein [Salinivirgaceae bacterium]